MYPKYLTDLLELPLEAFVQRAKCIKVKQADPSHEPANLLKNHPELANVSVESCRTWLANNSISKREGKTCHDSWLRLCGQIFEIENPDAYIKWKKDIDCIIEKMEKIEQLERLKNMFGDIQRPFANATGLGKKELIKKTPSAHFCKRYNTLLRKAKQLVQEIEEEVSEVLWPPELPGVDSLKDEQLVPNANYVEIHIYCSQVYSLLFDQTRTVEMEVPRKVQIFLGMTT